MQPIKLNCIYCNNEFSVIAPNGIYIEANREYKKNSSDDMLPMTIGCPSCRKVNNVYWYRQIDKEKKVLEKKVLDDVKNSDELKKQALEPITKAKSEGDKELQEFEVETTGGGKGGGGG